MLVRKGERLGRFSGQFSSERKTPKENEEDISVHVPMENDDTFPQQQTYSFTPVLEVRIFFAK